jgi:hypothetical protein
VKGKKQYLVKVENRFAAFENLDDVDISRAWENIRENINISAKGSLCYHEWKQNNHGLTKKVQNYYIKINKSNCKGFRIRAKCMEKLSIMLRSEASRQFRNKNIKYLKGSITEEICKLHPLPNVIKIMTTR